ncbi:putative maltokinase [Sinimarinibacterium flocculans]|uniref:putative maltokinase n=1 Tax=Sinimarinibacterium flocculans TaxID=985250 RepID=UPI003511E601
MSTPLRRAPRRRTSGLIDDPLWYKDAVIYQLHVKSFFDANDDGIGDFSGLIGKLDYIAGLGVNTVWLLPFYPSPRRDDGYDVSDYLNVHPDYGPLRDVRRFIEQAHARGLRVITELVINHTSDQHPWFQRARRARPGSPLRDFYVWSDDDSRYAGTRIIFVDTEKSNWTWDPVAKAYYWHRFYSHQPDLNYDNPRVIESVLDAMRHWLRLGVDGLRLDAVPYLVEREGTNNENLPETHAVLKRLRAEIDAAFPGRMLLAEANQWPEDVQHYFGGKPADGSAGGGGRPADESAGDVDAVVGDECHMAFHFPLMPRMYMAIAQEDRFPITDILRQTPDIPANCQWAIFLRNHDELTLEMVTDRERDYLWETYAADRRARLNIGIRRRLAPLVERDRRRIELLNSLLLSMPGTPVIYYGDEIGMGDNIFLGDRDGVRTPMQWSPDRNGGFSRADPARLVLPPIMDPLYGYQAINVEAQTRDAHSLLNWMRRMLAIRARCRAFGRGGTRLLYPGNRRILAYLREYDAGEGNDAQLVLCVANLSRAAQAVELDLAGYAGRVPLEMIGGSAFPPIGQLPYLMTLPPHGFYWFELASSERMPGWYVAPPEPMPELVTLVPSRGVDPMADARMHRRLEQGLLAEYLPRRRWFAARTERLEQVRVDHVSPLPHAQTPMALFELVCDGHSQERYLLPLGLLAEDAVITPLPQQLALARVRNAHRVSLLTDAVAIDAFAHTVVRLIGNNARLPVPDGELHFDAVGAHPALEHAASLEVRRLSVEQSNTSVVMGNQIILKLFRRIAEGPHPEAEMGRLLTARGFRNVAPLLGELVRVDARGGRHVLGIAQGYIHNQGDAWDWIQAGLQRALRDAALQPAGEGTPLAEMLVFAGLLGRRLAEMHAVLQSPGLGARVAGAEDADALAAQVGARLAQAFARLEALPVDLPEPAAALAAELLRQRDELMRIVPRLARAAEGSALSRIHGDLHLGQILVAQDDAYFVDFEGEPTQPLAGRRAVSHPLRDVAGILRSFDYAAERASRLPADDPAAAGAGDAVLQRFREALPARFLDAYRQTAAASPMPAADDGRLLDLLLIERAAHEIDYEASNRPDWLHLPMRGLLARLRETGDADV